MTTIVGMCLLVFGVLALAFFFTGEKALGLLPSVRRIRAVQNSWGQLQIDLPSLQSSWDHRAQRGVNPGEIRWFCQFQLVDVLAASLANNVDDVTRQRPLSDVIAAVGYRLDRISSLGHELRVYSFLYALMFSWHVYENSKILGKLFTGEAGLLELALDIGGRPLEFVSGLEAVMLAIFSTRLIGELAGYKHLTK